MGPPGHYSGGHPRLAPPDTTRSHLGQVALQSPGRVGCARGPVSAGTCAGAPPFSAIQMGSGYPKSPQLKRTSGNLGRNAGQGRMGHPRAKARGGVGRGAGPEASEGRGQGEGAGPW